MLPAFETARLILKPRTIDDLENCVGMDINPQVTEYIPGGVERFMQTYYFTFSSVLN